jgi:hypothetical protein
MPAKKSTQKKVSKKVASNPEDILQVNPPIIIGGGGSTLIWIKKGLYPKMIDPTADVSANAPKPRNPELYYCFECAQETRRATTHKGNGGNAETPHSGMNPQRHMTAFDDGTT